MSNTKRSAHSHLKLGVFAFWLIFVSTSTFAGDPNGFNALIAQKKYLSAYEILNTQDPKNENPSIFVKKVDTALNYYAICLSGNTFAFRDLQLGETIEKVRGSKGTYKMFPLNAEEDGKRLAASYPKDGNIHRALGDFYYHATEECGLGSSLKAKSLDEYQRAKDLGTANFMSLHNMGVLLLEQGKPVDALRELKASLALKPNQADTNYNAAFASMQLKQYKETASFAAKSFDLYEDEKLKSEAALLASVGYSEFKDRENTLKYSELAYKHKYQNYYAILQNILQNYVQLKEWQKASQIADEFFALQPTNPQLPQDIIDKYTHQKAYPQLKDFFGRNLTKYKGQEETIGNLLFHRAMYYWGQNNKAKAIEDYKDAEGHFRTVLKPDHPVFQAIHENLKKLKSQTN